MPGKKYQISWRIKKMFVYVWQGETEQMMFSAAFPHPSQTWDLTPLRWEERSEGWLRKGLWTTSRKIPGIHKGRFCVGNSSLHFVLGLFFFYLLSIMNCRDDFISKMLAVQAWEPRFRFLAFIFFKAVYRGMHPKCRAGRAWWADLWSSVASQASQSASDSVSIPG